MTDYMVDVQTFGNPFSKTPRVEEDLRECLCQRCRDDCITVTRSEFCSDCEVAHISGRSSCH